MKKTYIEAVYRIKDTVFNTGYICIDGDSIIGIFTLDCVKIEINNKKIYFHLAQYDFKKLNHSKTELFIGRYNIEFLESPRKYILKSDSNKTLEFELIKKITNPIIISKLAKQFKMAFEN